MPALSQDQIKQYLLQQDRKLAPLITSIKYPVSRRNTDVYGALLHSIVAQQLSVKAAATIHARVLELFPHGEPEPELLAKMPVSRLRRAGLSNQKAAYVKAIARVARDDGLNYKSLSKKSDVELVDYLTQIHGVGQWTVQMLLMFTFNRSDIFPVGDVGIQNAMRRLYGLKHEGRVLHQRMQVIAERWQPYRTIACRYLWRWKSNGYVDQ